jgi:2-amino-4-hydroxy-6-hydroxymethyldihydropteridine diphosphokinase
MRCLLSLGANLGRRAHQLAEALRLLGERPELTVQAVSEVYETEPAGYTDQPLFLNMAVAVEVSCDPLTLLDITQGIEAKLGRERSFANAPRTLDIDLLACDGIALQTDRLALPHPRLTERQFVLVPLADIAPEWPPPGTGQTVAQLADRSDSAVRRVGTLAEVLGSEA